MEPSVLIAPANVASEFGIDKVIANVMPSKRSDKEVAEGKKEQ